MKGSEASMRASANSRACGQYGRAQAGARPQRQRYKPPRFISQNETTHTHTKTLYDKGNGTSVHGVSFLINNTVLLHTMDVKTLKPSRFLITRRSLLREHCGFAFSWHLKWHIWPLWAIRCDLTTAATFKARKTKTLKRTDATSCLSLQQIQWKLFVNRSHIYSRIHPAVPDGSLVEVYLSCKLI